MGFFDSVKDIVSAPARIIGDVTGINEIRDNPMTTTGIAALLAGGAYGLGARPELAEMPQYGWGPDMAAGAEASTFPVNNLNTMTGQPMEIDWGNIWNDEAMAGYEGIGNVTPGVGDAGAFDQWGSLTGATNPTTGGQVAETIFGGTPSVPFPMGDWSLGDAFKALPGISSAMNIGKQIFGGGGGGQQGGKRSTGIPALDKLLGLDTSISPGLLAAAALEYKGLRDYRKDLLGLMDKAVERSDPFYSQRPGYQEKLPGMLDRSTGMLDNYNQDVSSFRKGYGDLFSQYSGTANRMFTDPTYWNNDPLLQGLNEKTVNDTSRAMSAQGYNMSGNVPMEIGQRLQQNNMGYAQGFQKNYLDSAGMFLDNYGRANLGGLDAQFKGVGAGNEQLNQVGNFAGANINPASTGQTMSFLGNAAGQAGVGATGAMGAGLNELLKNWKVG